MKEDLLKDLKSSKKLLPFVRDGKTDAAYMEETGRILKKIDDLLFENKTTFRAALSANLFLSALAALELEMSKAEFLIHCEANYENANKARQKGVKQLGFRTP